MKFVRLIQEEEPPKPSLRISSRGRPLPSVCRPTPREPQRLSGPGRGELDWIVMKALEKDRTRRYETATVSRRTFSTTSTISPCWPVHLQASIGSASLCGATRSRLWRRLRSVWHSSSVRGSPQARRFARPGRRSSRKNSCRLPKSNNVSPNNRPNWLRNRSGWPKRAEQERDLRVQAEARATGREGHRLPGGDLSQPRSGAGWPDDHGG